MLHIVTKGLFDAVTKRYSTTACTACLTCNVWIIPSKCIRILPHNYTSVMNFRDLVSIKPVNLLCYYNLNGIITNILYTYHIVVLDLIYEWLLLLIFHRYRWILTKRSKCSNASVGGGGNGVCKCSQGGF